MTRVRAVVGASAAALATAALAGAAGEPPGAIGQLLGRDGCVTATGDHGLCTAWGEGSVLQRPEGLAVSADGERVYVAYSEGGGVLAFARQSDGSLARAGCITAGTVAGCRRDPSLEGARDIAVVGNDLYAVTGFARGSVVVLRDTRSTGLVWRECFSDQDTRECDVGAGLDGAQRIAISPDGRALFAASPDEDAVAVFSRKPASGRIALPDGATKCLGRTGVGGCDVTRGLDQPVAVAVGVRSDAVYVAAYGSSSLVVLRRRRVDGRLTQPGGRNACVNSSGGHGCTQVNGLQQPRSLLVLPGHGQWVEEQVLVGSDLGGVVELFRKSNGTIGQRPGTGGCVYWTAVPAATGCRHAPNVGAGASALARGTMPETVYVAAIDGVLVLRPRDPSRPGGYAPLPQPYGCVNTNPDLNCLIGHGSLAGLLHVAVNGRSAYTISIGGTVGVFRRVATER